MITMMSLKDVRFYVGMGCNGVVIKASHSGAMKCRKCLPCFHVKKASTYPEAQERALAHLKSIAPPDLLLPSLIPPGEVVTINKLQAQQDEYIKGKNGLLNPMVFYPRKDEEHGN